MALQWLIRLYDGAVLGTAAFAGVLLALAPVGMIADATLRIMGLQPLLWVVPMGEYTLLYAAMLPAPWLIRTAGHVQVEALLERLGPRVRRRWDRAVHLVCAALCLLFAWFALQVAVEAIRFGELDMRGVTIPAIWLYAPVAVSFVLMTTEFLRLALGAATERAKSHVGL